MPTRSFLTAAMLIALALPAAAEGQDGLNAHERRIALGFPDVAHATPEQVETWIADRAPVVIIDVRPPTEFAVAHIPGALRLDPNASDLGPHVASAVAGRTVVLYCSIGYRSSKAAARLASRFSAAGAHKVVNMRGGIFGWHNTGRPLVERRGPTPFVHPYSAAWRPYVEFDNLAADRPPARIEQIPR